MIVNTPADVEAFIREHVGTDRPDEQHQYDASDLFALGVANGNPPGSDWKQFLSGIAAGNVTYGFSDWEGSPGARFTDDPPFGRQDTDGGNQP